MDETREMNSIAEQEKPNGEDDSGTYLDRDDGRFSKGSIKDWLTLLLMIATYLVWTGVVYFFEPGIR